MTDLSHLAVSGTEIAVRVTPKASRNAVMLADGVVRVLVTIVPEDGKATAEVQKALAGQKTVTIEGQLEYQACDDKVCYAPGRVPITFTLDLAPLQRP